jgi:hypothetical protein
VTSAGFRRMTWVCGMGNGAGTRPLSSGGGSGLRMEAAGRFARGDKISEIVRGSRLTPGPVRRWHRAWENGGPGALRSRGRCRGRS